MDHAALTSAFRALTSSPGQTGTLVANEDGLIIKAAGDFKGLPTAANLVDVAEEAQQFVDCTSSTGSAFLGTGEDDKERKSAESLESVIGK
ncbi:hypothetical protein H4R33_005225 [Dimargaris cristalligena]|nr:hypothetical protein H4R33_005225 [Dimargaris cristalligena]